MRGIVPGTPLVQHVQNAPSRAMGIGFALMIVGMVAVMFGPLGSSIESKALIVVGVCGGGVMLLGIFVMFIGYMAFERSVREREQTGKEVLR